jgi:hypothetical protein
MDTPQYINEVISDVRCIKPGWYAMDDVGNLSSGPFSSHAECFGSIVQPTVTFTAEVNELSTDIRPALRAGGSEGQNENRPLKDEGHD